MENHWKHVNQIIILLLILSPKVFLFFIAIMAYFWFF